MTSSNSDDIGVPLDRVTYLLAAVVVLQAIDVLGLGAPGLVVAVAVSLLVTALYNANVDSASRRRRGCRLRPTASRRSRNCRTR